MKYEEYAKKFGKAIKKYRIDKDISQEELADKAGMHVTYLSQIERGHANPTLKNIFKLASAMKMNLSDLLSL